ncbi:MAG: MBOAT family protein [Chitinophagales bacterium]|nr:MBOAT family protein [Chitinophagales bacterium]
MFDIDLSKVADQLLYDKDAPLIFSSGLFIYLFLGFLLLYTALRRAHDARMIWTTLFSIYFYYKSSGFYFFLLLGSLIIDFVLSHLIYLTQNKLQRKLLLVLSLVVNLGMLAYFKYTNYGIELWNFFSGAHMASLDIFLPVGISFFTFQSLSYTIDVYRNELKPQESFWEYSFFVTFFPQMVAGPIVRAADFLPQINQALMVTREQFGRGVFLITIGLFKKAVISDYISLNYVDRIFETPELYSGFENLIGVYGYALQIYCDFSGYSDMAIGIALLLGFTFPINFDSPYQSLSITEFWRRWHISLSTWLRDYLYIPLGGNRKGKIRTYINLMITMLLGGLWHGAATRFIIWGGLHGGALAVERLWKSWFPTEPGQLRKVLGGLWTFHFVCFCWIFFRASDLDKVWAILGQIAFDFQPERFLPFLDGYAKVVFWMGLGYILHLLPKSTENWAVNRVTQLPFVFKVLLIFLMAVLVMQMKSAEVQPFIYFQF